jgi:hypothetical protein
LLGMVWIGFFHIWACVLLEGMEHSRLGCVEPAVRAVFKNRDVHTVCVEWMQCYYLENCILYLYIDDRCINGTFLSNLNLLLRMKPHNSSPLLVYPFLNLALVCSFRSFIVQQYETPTHIIYSYDN